MKFIVLLALGLTAVFAAPQQSSRDATIVKYEADNDGFSGYKFNFETSDGVSRSETGELKNAGTDNEALVMRGTISWIGADGTPYTIEFIADENGFQPKGAHFPK
ncbi:endocuticle structural protein SgAbd-6-like [Sitophilus oryzae]|uniref:Endocuticle structural protein SgAbd-6-like n=1 Tax=Sitophilus oryzae TaxID=7048 RepID=A0A6J2X6C2_SITOR|nr:endocuticle structural protein SgAbd-6-like [Sitophilus oryzae]